MSPWLQIPDPRQHVALQALVVPHAGASPRAYRAFARGLPKGIEAWVVAYPGRGPRIETPVPERMDALVAPVVDALCAAQGQVAPCPLAVIGHSMGSVVAYEIALALAASGSPPDALVVSSCAPPHMPRPHPLLSTLADDEITALLKRWGLIGSVLADDSEAMAEVLPLLKADFALLDTYRWDAHTPRLDCPILTITADADPLTPQDAMRQWAQHTTAAAEHLTVEGGHFAFLREADRIATLVGDRLLR